MLKRYHDVFEMSLWWRLNLWHLMTSCFGHLDVTTWIWPKYGVTTTSCACWVFIRVMVGLG